MTSEPLVRFFGDAEYRFDLTDPVLIADLERRLGVGIGALARRVLNHEWRHVDLAEIVRTALVGGGCKAEDAASLVRTYLSRMPLGEVQLIAVEVLDRLWNGAPKTEAAT